MAEIMQFNLRDMNTEINKNTEVLGNYFNYFHFLQASSKAMWMVLL